MVWVAVQCFSSFPMCYVCDLGLHYTISHTYNAGQCTHPSATLRGARPASWSVATVRCTSHASGGALCSSEPRSAAGYVMASGDGVNAPSSSSSFALQIEPYIYRQIYILSAACAASARARCVAPTAVYSSPRRSVPAHRCFAQRLRETDGQPTQRRRLPRRSGDARRGLGDRGSARGGGRAGQRPRHAAQPLGGRLRGGEPLPLSGPR